MNQKIISIISSLIKSMTLDEAVTFLNELHQVSGELFNELNHVIGGDSLKLPKENKPKKAHNAKKSLVSTKKRRGDKLSNREMMLEIINSKPLKAWRFKDIMEKMPEANQNACYVQLYKCLKKKEIKRAGRGLWASKEYKK